MKNQEGEGLQYIEGWAWGVAPDGKTVCLGTEEDVRTILANPRHHPSNPTIAQVIGLERKINGQNQRVTKLEQKKEQKERAERHKRAVAMGVAKTRKARTNKK